MSADGFQNGLHVPAMPHNLDAEQIVLGAILFDNEIFKTVNERLRPEHFHDPVHGAIYEAVGQTIASGRLADALTMRTHFAAHEGLKELGGAQYLITLLANAATMPTHVQEYGDLVFDLSQRRELVRIGEEIMRKARGEGPAGVIADDLISDAETKIREVSNRGGMREAWVEAGAAATRAIEMAARGRVGFPTGLTDYDRITFGFDPGNLTYLGGRPSMGKAQSLDAKILLADGSWTRMGDIRLGAEVASIDGRRSLVSGVFPQGEKQLYRVTFSDGRSTECCAEHLWSVTYRDWDAPRVMSTAELIDKLKAKRYQNRLWIDMCSGHFGAPRDVPIDPWLLGALLGDGSTRSGGVTISTPDAEIVEGVRAVAGVGMTRRAPGASLDWRLTDGRLTDGRHGRVSNPVTNGLRALGLYGVASHEKFIPDAYKMLPRADRLALLHGLMDTDGWIESFNCARFSSASEGLADDVVYLARSLGLWASKSRKTNVSFVYKGERKSGRDAFLVTIAGDEMLFRLNKKAVRQKPRARAKRAVIASIEPTRMAEAQCIAVTHPSHLYVTDDFVVTHNTAVALGMLTGAIKQAARNGVGAGALLISLEMTVEQVGMRLAFAEADDGSRAPNDRPFCGTMDDARRKDGLSAEEKRLVDEATKRVESMPLMLDERGRLTMSQIKSACGHKIDEMRRKGIEPAVVCIDHLGLAVAETNRGGNRTQEVGDMSAAAKAMAKDLGVHVLALHQLNRAVEGRDDKRPQLSDLRDSGTLEQDADVVTFVYREAYYLEREGERKNREEEDVRQANIWNLRNTTELNVAKHRNGPIGTAKIFFDLRTAKIDNLYQPNSERASPRRA